MDHPHVVTLYIQEELQANLLLLVGSHTGCTLQPMPKKNKPGKWRLILDLSTPKRHSVNDGISKELCSLSYTSVDEVVASTITYGKGAIWPKWISNRLIETFQCIQMIYL